MYAYGILMWEMYTAQRPYGNMKQQQLVEEVRASTGSCTDCDFFRSTMYTRLADQP